MAFLAPGEIVKNLSIDEGMVIADIGSGSGAFAVLLAQLTGRTGRVYAIDINKEVLIKIKRDAGAEGLSNVEIIWGDVEKAGGTKLADNSVDFALVSNILFQSANKKGLVEEVGRILKPKGKVAVIDWTGSFGGLGPKDSAVFPESEAKKLFTDSLFGEYNKFDAGDYHYGVTFIKIK
jgi:ubiquinone/menaquinone biosynthesis C-methylase UbiE